MPPRRVEPNRRILTPIEQQTSPRASEREMTRFHSDEYINFLRIVTPDNMTEHANNLSRFNILEDCPVFDGLWEYCQIAAGGSLAGAARLNAGESETVINWAGGLHHAKRSEASGFCYINDCVLAILELLKVHSRVLYVDIDIHHGDGVEEAFYTTDRVMTASFHKYGDYFPGTGDVTDVGIGRGKNYCVNFPLKDGIDDQSYREVFVPVMTKVMEWYKPGAVVLQCGADSLSGDRLGCFNLSLKGHAQCVDFFGNYDVPLLMLGGGGYTIRNVARCWAYETSRVINADISDDLPYNDNYEFYGPEFRLHITPSNMENQNTREYLEDTKSKIIEHLRNLPHVPSVPMMDVPRSSPLGVHNRDYDSENDDPDARKKVHKAKRIQEFEDSDGEDEFHSSLSVSRRKVRKSSFPRRDNHKGSDRTTTSNSANLLAAANQAYLGSTTAANGAVADKVDDNATATGGTAVSSEERVEPGPPHADDDVVDSSKARTEKKDEDKMEVDTVVAPPESTSSAKRPMSSEEANNENSPDKPSKPEKTEAEKEPPSDLKEDEKTKDKVEEGEKEAEDESKSKNEDKVEDKMDVDNVAPSESTSSAKRPRSSEDGNADKPADDSSKPEKSNTVEKPSEDPRKESKDEKEVEVPEKEKDESVVKMDLLAEKSCKPEKPEKSDKPEKPSSPTGHEKDGEEVAKTKKDDEDKMKEIEKETSGVKKPDDTSTAV